MNDASLLLKLPQKLKDALEARAYKAGVSTQGFIRETLAKAIDFNLAEHGRAPAHNKRFATPEDRRQFYIAQKRKQRALEKHLLSLPPLPPKNS